MVADGVGVSRSVEIVNRRGLHARASARLAKKAGEFQAVIKVCKRGICVTATSIMGLMMLGASKGDTISISAEGNDQDTAIDQIIELIANRFGETE